MDLPPNNTPNSNCTQTSNSEDDRHSNASAETVNPPASVSNIPGSYTASVASSSARQSPKVLPSQMLLPLRNSISPSVPRKIMGKNHNKTGKFLQYILYTYYVKIYYKKNNKHIKPCFNLQLYVQFLNLNIIFVKIE